MTEGLALCCFWAAASARAASRSALSLGLLLRLLLLLGGALGLLLALGLELGFSFSKAASLGCKLGVCRRNVSLALDLLVGALAVYGRAVLLHEVGLRREDARP
jgi:uncharacterized membrane protein